MTTETTHQPLPRRTESGMRTRAVNAAAGVLQAAMEQGRQTPTGLAIALDSARLLNSPEHAARVAELEAQREALAARLAEYERPADEDPIAYALTEQADDVTPQVAKLRALLAGQATDGSEFFQPGHAYTHRPGADTIGGPRVRFYCETVTTDRTTGQPIARGWGGRRYGDRWTSVQRARGLEDWQSGQWVDTTAGGDQ